MLRFYKSKFFAKMSDIKKKLEGLKKFIDPYQLKFVDWYKNDKSVKKFRKVVDPYQTKVIDWYKKSKRNKNILRIGGAVLIVLLGKSILGGGPITVKAQDGSKVEFKRENIFCYQEDNIYGLATLCTANGIKKDLTGDKTSFSQNAICDYVNNKGEDFEALYQYALIQLYNSGELDSIACGAAEKKGLI